MSPEPPISRRTMLAVTSGSLVVGSAGCLETLGFGDPDCDFVDQADTSTAAFAWDDLDDLEGELIVYSGRTSDQIYPIFRCLEEHYPDFTVRVDWGSNEEQLNKLRQEGAGTEADLFYSQDSSALASLAAEGYTQPVSHDVRDIVPADIRDPDGLWTATSGRVRAVQYNTDLVDPAELSDDIFAYAEDDRYAGRIATRPNSGSFLAFIHAMFDLHGRDETEWWVESMVEQQQVELYGGGSNMARAVADGDVEIALGNQYYAARLIENDPTTPIGLEFTRNDAGALFNVAGVAVTDAAGNASLANETVKHLLAAEGQHFFVRVNGEYPVIDGIEYVGDLPNPDALESPRYNLSQLIDFDEVNQILTTYNMRV